MVVAALAAFASYWMVLPTINAHRFKDAIKSGKFATADRLFKDRELLDFGTIQQLSNATIDVAPLTWTQVLRGERYVLVHIPYGQRMADFDWDITIRATRGGLVFVCAIT